MLLSELIVEMQATLALHGDAEVVDMSEIGGDLVYMPVTGVGLDDYDSDDNEAPMRYFVINTDDTTWLSA